MFSAIVVGVDAREGGRDALALGGAFARLWGAELVAVHAYPYDYYVSRGAGTGLGRALHGGAMETLEAELAAAGVGAKPVAVPDSSPARALHLAAEHEHAELIVVGSAHRGILGRVLAGDVTAGTLQGAPCAVAVAPAGYARKVKPLEAIGVGYDGSPESRVAVEFARDLAERADAKLRVVDVLVPLQPGGLSSSYVLDWTEHARVRREEAEERIALLLAELGDLATGDVAVGDPADELAYEGNALDLLVTGSRNFGPLRRLMLGSTSMRLVHRAPCPVLVVPRAGQEETTEPDAPA